MNSQIGSDWLRNAAEPGRAKLADVKRGSIGGLLFLFFPIALSLAVGAAAQTVDIRVDTTLVVVPVTVTDSANRFVLGMEKRDFRVFEGDAEQKVTHFSGEDAPL